MHAEPPEELTDDELADLARLADGTLPAERRAEVEARVAASQRYARVMEQQGMAIEALHTAVATGAPARLRANVERRRGAHRAPARARSRLLIGGAIATAAAVVLALVLVLPTTLSGDPSVSDAAALAHLAPTKDAPAGVPDTPQLLRADVDGVPFPDYTAKFGWKPDGARQDDPSGRKAKTVFYRKGDRTIAYTIVSGDRLDPPENARVTKRGGVEFRSVRAGGRTIVTWERGGHTCVLSSSHASPDELVALADWRGKGAIPF
jgi:anti-sigma factor RsiW